MSRRDTLQNIAIILLTASALFLFSQTQFFRLGAASGDRYFRELIEPAAASSSPSSATLSAPVHIAVTSEYGRYGNVALTTVSDEYLPVKTLLREVLGSAGAERPVSRKDLIDSLRGTSVYCDFLTPLPISYLADLAGAEMAGERAVRALAVFEQSGTAALCLWDGADGCLVYQTAVPASSLDEVVGSYELGSASFAFEDESSYGERLAPLSLLPDTLPELPQLTVTLSAPESDAIFSALRFNPHTNSRYTESGGTEVIVEGDRSLRIGADGTVSYTGGGGEAAVTVGASASPSVTEAVSATAALLDSLLSGGDAQLYLRSAARSGEDLTLSFGYQIGGVPVRYTDALPAAEVTLSGNTVTAMVVRLRRYDAAGDLSALLPLPQAIAIAARNAGSELSLGYADGGVYPLSACWLAD